MQPSWEQSSVYSLNSDVLYTKTIKLPWYKHFVNYLLGREYYPTTSSDYYRATKVYGDF